MKTARRRPIASSACASSMTQRRQQADGRRARRVEDQPLLAQRAARRCPRRRAARRRARRRASARGRAPRRRRAARPARGAGARPARARAPSSVLVVDDVEHGAGRPRTAPGPPAKVEPWSPGAKTSARRGPVTSAPIGSPPPSALADRHRVGHDAGVLRRPTACRCAPARTGSRRRSARRRARRRPRARRAARSSPSSSDAALALHRLEQDGGGARRRRPRAIASAVGSTATKPGTSGANGACLDSCGVADSEPYVRPWKPRCTDDDVAAAAWPCARA